MMLCFGCCIRDSFAHCNKIHTIQVHHVAEDCGDLLILLITLGKINY